MAHVMVDLETWGTRPGCAIRSLGACVFDPMTGEIGMTFYANISDASCEAAGLTKDPRTVKWWADQSAAAKAALLPEQRELGSVLINFAGWWRDIRGVQVWGHGANFDPVILEAAFEAMLLEAPWKFWNVRCSRTTLAMARRKPLRGAGTHHNALDDAKAQAVAVAAAFRTGKFEAC